MNNEQMPARVAVKTNRSMPLVIILSIVTFGIYAIIFYYSAAEDVNTIIAKRDGKNTMNYILAIILGAVTFGIFTLVWMHLIYDRIGGELARRNISYSFGPLTFWGWGLLGAFIVVGPFIALHKFCTALNLISENYNTQG